MREKSSTNRRQTARGEKRDQCSVRAAACREPFFLMMHVVAVTDAHKGHAEYPYEIDADEADADNRIRSQRDTLCEIVPHVNVLLKEISTGIYQRRAMVKWAIQFGLQGHSKQHEMLPEDFQKSRVLSGDSRSVGAGSDVHGMCRTGRLLLAILSGLPILSDGVGRSVFPMSDSNFLQEFFLGNCRPYAGIFE